MPDDVKISEMSEAASLDNSAQFPYVQSMNGNLTTLKAPLSQIGTKINEGMTFSNLQTTSKTIVGAINEAAQGGGVEYATELPISSTDPTDTKSYIDTKTTLVKSASGSLIHITDGGDNIPMKSLESEIVAVESGNGQPKSPDNPYTISGFDSGVVSVCGINIWDEQWENGHYNTQTGAKQPNVNKVRNKNPIRVLPNTTYFIKTPVLGTNVFLYDLDMNYVLSATLEVLQGNTFTTPNNAYYMNFSTFGSDYTVYNHDISINYPSTDTQYHAYNGNTYTFTFGQTVYGGHFDNKGNLVVTHGYIASYNGETINEPWISSMDNYVPNTSPSTGAQVVYPLTTPNTLSITSQDIPTLSGENNIFSNCGDLDIEYFTESADGLAALIEVLSNS